MSLNRRIYCALMLFVGIITVGTLGYMNIEGYSLLDSLYMSIITITTVGFGDIVPVTAPGKVFTTGLIIVGFISLAFAGHAVAESLLQEVWNDGSEKKRMKKKIEKLQGHYIVCGFGRVGAPAAELFKKEGADFIIIESQPEQIAKIQEKGMLYIDGDATREAVLKAANIKAAKGLLALLGSDPENLFVVLTARECNPTLHIISRVEYSTSESRMLRAGADMVVSPFTSAGKEVAANSLVATGRVSLSPASSSYTRIPSPQWIRVQEGSGMIGQTLKTVAEQMGREILGLRRENQDQICPDPTIELACRDMLFVLDEEQETELSPSQQRPIEPQKLVIVDDNPVILRLYTRLFQKAGFHVHTADNGRDGLEIILRERPAAAVIDFMLPKLSGINVCAEVCAAGFSPDTKLILFTADDDPETRASALRAGADAVVVKSPEAAEVIDTVFKILKQACPSSKNTHHDDEKESSKKARSTPV
ncbi:MAG: NAD-binding protein [Planctomycetota bacterium]